MKPFNFLFIFSCIIAFSIIFSGCTITVLNIGNSSSNTGSIFSNSSSVTTNVNIQTYSVSYDGNGNTGGNPPVDPALYQQGQTVTVPGNTGSLIKTGFGFTGWNTSANGNGITYSQAQVFTMGASNVVLYADWTTNPTYSVIYNGNGSTGGGSVPDDNNNYTNGQLATVLGNTGNLYNGLLGFAEWNTHPDGSGMAYILGNSITVSGSGITLYAYQVCSGKTPSI